MIPTSTPTRVLRLVLSALAYTALLALLWLLRPPLPEIRSLTESPDASTLEEVGLLIVWVAVMLALIRLLFLTVRALAVQPSRRRLLESQRLERVLDNNTREPETLPDVYQRYRPPLRLTVQPQTPLMVEHSDRGQHTPDTTSETEDRGAASAIRVSLLGRFTVAGAEDTHLRSASQQLIAYLALRGRVSWAGGIERA